jgi:hypothetical protein
MVSKRWSQFWETWVLHHSGESRRRTSSGSSPVRAALCTISSTRTRGGAPQTIGLRLRTTILRSCGLPDVFGGVSLPGQRCCSGSGGCVSLVSLSLAFRQKLGAEWPAAAQRPRGTRAHSAHYTKAEKRPTRKLEFWLESDVFGESGVRPGTVRCNGWATAVCGETAAGCSRLRD